MNIIAIIQARMGSTRLPGKIMMDIEGSPMLKRVIDRLGECRHLNDVVVATSNEEQDDPVEDFCLKSGVHFYRGSHNDVLDRYYQASREYNADVVVRITSDCPLIDPDVVDRTVSAYLDNINEVGGASNVIKRTFPRGLDTEVFAFRELETAWKEAKDPGHREHVTVYFYRNPDKFKIYSVENESDMSYFRWTVDEKADLEMVREIYRRLGSNGRHFLLKDIVSLLEKEPAITDINRHIKQKTKIK